MAPNPSCWSDLLPDVLILIFSRLEIVEFIRAAATCRSWRKLKSRSKDFHVRPKNQIPWLMVSSPTPFQTQFRYFHSLLPGSHPHGIRLPEIPGLFCIGSSQGFLISLDEATADLRAINPITGTHIPLPPTSPIAYGNALHIEVFWLGIGKAILSPDAGLGGRPQTVAFFYRGRLAFAQSGDCKWTLLANSRVLCFVDILFHKNRLHAVDLNGVLAAFDLGDPSVPQFLVRLGLPKIRHIKCYLVESPNGHDLYCVTKSFDLLCFWVYKLDELEGQWIEVNSLGDLALFLGFNHSLALSATEHPNIKRNSIYFTWNLLMGPITERSNFDMGVFDLGDQSVQRLSLSCLSWQPPIWFTPAL